MKKGYKGLLAILTISLLLFFVASSFETINIFGMELKSSGMYDRVTRVKEEVKEDTIATGFTFPQPLDTASKHILFIGDSMLEGLSPRLAAYAKHNGHKMHTVIWYSSRTDVWGGCDTLTHFIRKYDPDYIFICLGANELFYKNIIERHGKYVDRMLKQIGDIPYVWIGPPNWKPDTGINELIESKVPEGCFFVSNGMHFDRAKDGAHPTRSSAILWMDSVARWMPQNCRFPIKMSLPTVSTSRPIRTEVLQPQK